MQAFDFKARFDLLNKTKFPNRQREDRAGPGEPAKGLNDWNGSNFLDRLWPSQTLASLS
jgi:hypothetical protein